jgi:uncharacterized membrane protein
MLDPKARTFTGDFKRFFIRGLAVLLPSVLTLWLLVTAYQFVDRAIAEPVNSGVRAGIARLATKWDVLRERFEPTEAELEAVYEQVYKESGAAPDRSALTYRARQQKVAAWWTARRWYMDLIGLAIAIIAVYIAGRLLGGFFGRQIYAQLERVITHLPLIKQVYPAMKQLTEFFFSENRSMKFSRVVFIEYPRKGVWSLGFLTGGSIPAAGAALSNVVTVFVPSSPTPFTGYTISLPRGEVIDTDIPVEEALKFIVSGGVIMPQASGRPDASGPPSGLPLPPATAQTQTPTPEVPPRV